VLVGLCFQSLIDRYGDALFQIPLSSDCEPLTVYSKLAFSSTFPAARCTKHVLINLVELESCQHSPSVIPVILFLVEQIRPAASQIDDLRTSIPVLLKPSTFKAVEGIADPFPTTYDAFVLVIAEAAFVADAHKGCGTHVGVTDRAFAIAFVAETTHRDAGSFAAHYQIGVVARHVEGRRVVRMSSFVSVWINKAV
jgi:hypothetical protein